MEKITWKYVKPLKNSSIVDVFLQNKNIILPDNLLEVIKKYNGGRPSVFLFDTDQAKEYVFQSLYSYNEEDKNSIYLIYDALFSNKSVYPIGLEASGNIVCYDLEEKKYVLWNHETDTCETILSKIKL